MGTTELSTEEFIGHSGSASGGSYLKNWKDPKKGGAGFMHFLLSRRCSLAVALWRHTVPMIDIVEDKETREPKKIIRFQRLLCPEPEAFLKKQKWHENKGGGDGSQTVAVTCCPVHKIIEHCYQQVQRGELSIVDEVFRWDVGDGKPIIRYAGGVCELFKSKDLTPEELKAMKARGIFQTEAFQHSMYAKLEYAFRGLDMNDVGAGLQIAVESGLIGDQMKLEIKKAMSPAVWGPERGNPIKAPYVFRWEAHPEESEPGKKYAVLRAEGIPISEAAMKHITDDDPPGLGGLTKSPNWPMIRAQLEKAALIDLPWDELFADAPSPEDDKKVAQQQHVPQARPHEVRAPEPQRAPPPLPPVPRRGTQAPAPSPHRLAPPIPPARQVPAPAAAEDMFACDGCGKPVRASDPTCPHCGYQFDVQVAAPPPSAPPLRKRSELAAPAAAPQRAAPAPAAAAPARRAPPPPPPAPAGSYAEEGQLFEGGESIEDDIPFLVDETTRRSRRV